MKKHKATFFVATKGVGINLCGKSDWPYFYPTNRDTSKEQEILEINNIYDESTI